VTIYVLSGLECPKIDGYRGFAQTPLTGFGRGIPAKNGERRRGERRKDE